MASHFGGTRHGMAVSWPRRIADAGGTRTQFHHVIDIVPTILEATGIPAPRAWTVSPSADGRRLDGLHFRRGRGQRRHEAQPSTSRCWATRASTMMAGSPIRRRPHRRGTHGRRSPTDVANGLQWELYNLADGPDADAHAWPPSSPTGCARCAISSPWRPTRNQRRTRSTLTTLHAR